MSIFWDRIREEAHNKLAAEITTGNITDIMIRSAADYEIVHCMVRVIMTTKEMEDRTR